MPKTSLDDTISSSRMKSLMLQKENKGQTLVLTRDFVTGISNFSTPPSSVISKK